MVDSSNHIYYYLYNLQGDVIALADSATGKLAATYTYDAWGKLVKLEDTTANSVGTLNPFRYRGYYYDSETELYYLQSRYYDADTGRFINLDSRINGGVLGGNLFSYCLNNPIIYIDDCGQMPIALIPIAALLEEFVVDLGITIFALRVVDYTIDEFTSLEPRSEPQTSIPDNPSPKAQVQEKTEVDAKVDHRHTHRSIYYGCRILNNQMLIITDPMNYNEAFLWAYTMTLGSNYGIGKNSKWGLYTQYKKDAYAMAYALGANSEPIYDPPIFTNHYPHYHVYGRNLNGIFKHFHVWYSY